jgi:hypothetical protein
MPLFKWKNNSTKCAQKLKLHKSRLNYLSGLTTYSTLTISFYTPNTYIAEKPTYGAKIKTAFGNGWKFILQFIISITTIWPLFIFVVLGWYGYRFYKTQNGDDKITAHFFHL